jgi:hypothetical protein
MSEINLRAMPPYRDLLLCAVSTQLHHYVSGFDEIIAPEDSDFASKSAHERLEQRSFNRKPRRTRRTQRSEYQILKLRVLRVLRGSLSKQAFPAIQASLPLS